MLVSAGDWVDKQSVINKF